MFLLAHRGASRDAPENTLEAFDEAVTQRADGVELDAMVCGSGEVVVCHDERLERLTGRGGDVRRLGYSDLRQRDVGTRLGFSRARIPLLDEVLERLPSHFLINIELKCDTAEDHGLAVKVAELVKRRRLSERVLVSSFNALCLFRMARAAPGLRRGYLIDEGCSFPLHAYALSPLVSRFSVHPFHEYITPARMRTWAAAGLKVVTWTVDDVARARRLREMGVAYLITNHPRRLREGLAGD